MIARDFFIPAIPHAGGEDASTEIAVWAVGREYRKSRRPGRPPLPSERRGIAERRPEQTCDGAGNGHPHVEVTANDERGGEGGVPQQIGRQQHRCLLASLPAGKTPVQVEEMQALAVREGQVGTQASARLAARDGEVVVLCPGDGEPRED